MNLPACSFGPALLFAMTACGSRMIDLGDRGAGGADGTVSTAAATTSGSGATGSTGTSSGMGSTGSSSGTSSTSSGTFSTTASGTTITSSATSGTSGATTVTSSTTTGAGGSGIDPVPAASCEGICSRAINSGCAVGGYEECVQSCYVAWKMFPQCSMQFDQYLQCLAMNPINCASGTPQTNPCAGAFEPYARCTSARPPIDAGVSQCASIPRMPGPMVCSGGGSSAATSGGGPSRQCSRQCTDANKNTWIAECVGNSCACWMNGRQVCQCTTVSAQCAPLGDCCPF